MTKLDAQRQIREYGQEGNWRFRALMLAACRGGPSWSDVAKAWPTHGTDYKFLQANPAYSYENERSTPTKAAVWEDTEEYHTLSNYAEDALEEGNVEGQHTFHVDSAIQHMLFAASTPEELDTLFRNQLADVVAEGAQRRQAARQGAFIFNAQTNSGTVTVADDRQYFYASGTGEASGGIGEGGIIPDDREGYTTVSWDCIKVGGGARVTDEMVRHAQVDLIERQITHIGEATENDINRIWINELVDNAGAEHDTTGSDQGVKAVNAAVTEVDKNDFMAETLVTHPEARQVIFDDTNVVYANRSGDNGNALQNRELPPALMGLSHLAMNDAAYDSASQTWGYAADGEMGMVAYQQESLWLVIEQDIEIKDYEDPIRDLQGVNARAWVDAKYAQPNAAARIEF